VPGRGDGRSVEVLADDGNGLVAHEGRPAAHHFVEHRAQGVKVALDGDLTAGRLLRGHIGDGADHHAGAGEAASIQGDRQAEVADLGRPIDGEPDVARFQIPVDDAMGMGVLQGLANLVR